MLKKIKELSKNNFVNISILLISLISYLVYNYFKGIKSDTFTVFMLSGLFALGVFSIIKSFQYLIISKKIMAIIIKTSSTGINNFQDINSYSIGYSYVFLAENKEYFMPKYFHFGSKYYKGHKLKIAILDENKKIALPMRAVYNILFIGFVSLYISITILYK